MNHIIKGIKIIIDTNKSLFHGMNTDNMNQSFDKGYVFSNSVDPRLKKLFTPLTQLKYDQLVNIVKERLKHDT